MGQQQSVNSKKNICLGILAHVDAGKTTLSESLLYQSGSIGKLGRVDNQDAFLDTHELERARGITIFSKQAILTMGELQVTLLDTPGHVDFSAEMERTLQVLDYAILLISGADGVQGHTRTLWRLLSYYQIPTFIFINKMDQPGTDRQKLMEELQQQFGDGCVDFSRDNAIEQRDEAIAMTDERALEYFLEQGELSDQQISKLIAMRKVFPCYFGSALKQTGVESLMEGLQVYTENPQWPQEFGARVYKIARDEQGNRLTYMKITGGILKVKDLLSDQDTKGDSLGKEAGDSWQEKVNQIRIYSGAKYQAVDQVQAGSVCAVTGLTRTYPGEGLGIESNLDMPVLEPVLTYQIQLPEDCDAIDMLGKLKQLEEEEPQLHIAWDENLGEIHAKLMGEIQIQILRSLIWDRFKVRVEFGQGNIVYKETIADPVEGVGHFEPLRHYAEVHLLLEPAERGSGMQFAANCSEDELDGNWQRLILTHLEEKIHRGVLTGSEITDMKITLVAGRAHQKHTEGGDFRQATYRAVRQGLKKANSILLEPWYEFRLEVPQEMIGRAMTDIQQRKGTFDPPETDGQMTILTGRAPVETMRDYATEVLSYTGGTGRLSCSLSGYAPCHNGEEVIQQIGYDAERDLDNPTGSVFCSHGAGFVVPWDQVEDQMHLPAYEIEEKPEEQGPEIVHQPARHQARALSYEEEYEKYMAAEKELEEIFHRTFGANAKAEDHAKRRKRRDTEPTRKPYVPAARREKKKEYLLVDGYNIIYAWEELRDLVQVNLDGARAKLMDIMSNYQGYKQCEVILVFDAYKVKGNPGSHQMYHNIHVIYTKEAETADAYIEKAAHEMGRKYHVTVATSDGLEQLIITGQGCALLSARELEEEIRRTRQQIEDDLEEHRRNGR